MEPYWSPLLKDDDLLRLHVEKRRWFVTFSVELTFKNMVGKNKHPFTIVTHTITLLEHIMITILPKYHVYYNAQYVA
jgi:hypothetical protein